MKNYLLVLIKYNTILSRRIRGKQFPYISIVILTAAIVIIGGVLCTVYEHNRFMGNFNLAVSLVMYFVFLVDAMFLTTIFSASTQILPSQLVLFPVSSGNSLNFYLVSIISNIRLIIYLSVAMILGVNFFMISIALGFVFILGFISYFITIELSIVLCMLLISKYFSQSKGITPILTSFLLIAFQGMLLTGSLKLTTKIPIIGWVGQGCLSFQNQDYYNVILYLIGFITIIAAIYMFARRCFRYWAN